MDETNLIIVARGEENLGRLTIDFATDCLRAGMLRPDDIAWTEGMAEWTPLGDLLGLRESPAPAG